MKYSKRLKEVISKIDQEKMYSLKEAITLVRENANTRFDETIECAVRLGLDTKKSDQMVRSTVVLPHGRGKSVRVLVLTKGDKEKEAQDAGADYVGAKEYIDKIQGGWLEFDSVVATPDMMRDVGKLGKILGTKGLMPNPKSGTVTTKVAEVVKLLKAGRLEFRNDKAGNVHVVIGKASFSEDALLENAQTVLNAIIQSKPSSAKGNFIKGISVSSTMGAGIKVNEQTISIN